MRHHVVVDRRARHQVGVDAAEGPRPQRDHVGRPRVVAAEGGRRNPRSPPPGERLPGPGGVGMGRERPRPLQVVQVVAPQLGGAGGRPRLPHLALVAEEREPAGGVGLGRRVPRVVAPIEGDERRRPSGRRRPEHASGPADHGAGKVPRDRSLPAQAQPVEHLGRPQVADGAGHEQASGHGGGDHASCSASCLIPTENERGSKPRSRRAGPMSNALSSARRWSCSALSRGRAATRS